MTTSLQHTSIQERPKLRDVCHYGEGKQEDEFVGIRYADGKLDVYFPYGYSRPNENEKEYRKDILNLISVLASYSKESKFANQSRELNKDKVQIPIHAYLHVFNYFLNHGYYVENEPLYKRAKSGKINWARTIKQVRPQIAGETPHESVVYLDFITKKSNNNENEIITQIHKYCVYESYEKIGCLFGFFQPEKPQIPFNARMFAAILKGKISRSFNEKHLLLFRNMLDIVCYLGLLNDTRKASFGTTDFEYVWEGLIDDVFGIDENQKKTYYPHCSWHIGESLNDAERNETKRTALRPDTIMIPDKSRIFILDAKYYQYGEDTASSKVDRNPRRLPGTGSIIKQIAYAEFIETMRKKDSEIPQGEIFNAFILPYAAEFDETKYPMENFGYATCDWKNDDSDGDANKRYNKIYGILLDVRSIMQRHPKSSDKDIEELASLITEKECSSFSPNCGQRFRNP